MTDQSPVTLARRRHLFRGADDRGQTARAAARSACQNGAVAERAGVPAAGRCGCSARAAAVAQLQGHDGRWDTVVHAAAPSLRLA